MIRNGLLLSLLCTASFTLFSYVSFVDFDDSMGVQQYQHIIEKHNNKLLLDLFKQLYQWNMKNIPQRNGDQLRIPKLMHHIWFGVPFSQEFKRLRKTWLDRHTDWTFIFWTDRPINDPDAYCVYSFQELEVVLEQGMHKRIVVDVHALEFDNRYMFDATKNYGERSDILKWEVVYRYGGVYIDTDFECYQPLDPLHELFDFYTGLQPLDTGRVQLGAALFAAHPHHTILARCVSDARPGSGPIVIRTGPIHFTHCLVKAIGTALGRNIVLPSSYFYPCGYEQQNVPEEVWRTQEAFGVHHWSGSWLKPEGRVQ